MEKLTKRNDLTARWPRDLEKASEARHTKANDPYASPNALRVSKDRKAYLEAKVAEFVAAGYRAKIVGKGSYAEVSVYEVATVAGATQYRGTCQVCGGHFSVGYDSAHPDRLSFHGYTRPGHGYTIGECWGVNHPAAEVNVDLSKASIIRLRESADKAEKRAAAIIAKHSLTEWQVSQGWVSRTDRETKTFDQLQPAQQANILQSGARNERQAAQSIETYILPRLGQPFYEKVVAL